MRKEVGIQGSREATRRTNQRQEINDDQGDKRTARVPKRISETEFRPDEATFVCIPLTSLYSNELLELLILLTN